MFELSVALKYLIPKWRQLSVSIISLISIVVIALVVWLIVVFFSVTYGLEKSWVQKLIALTAPVRVSPTPDYYRSYYYQIDEISADSDYTHKSIEEKLAALKSDPYDPDFDEEVPMKWLPPDIDADGSLKDITKKAYHAIQNIPQATVSDYEMTVATLNLKLIRNYTAPGQIRLDAAADNDTELSQPMYLSSYDSTNSALLQSMLPVRTSDIKNVLEMADTPESKQRIYQAIKITRSKAPEQGLRLSDSLLPKTCTFKSCLVKRNGKIVAAILPMVSDNAEKIQKTIGEESFVAELHINGPTKSYVDSEGNEGQLSDKIPLFLEKGVTLPVKLEENLTLLPTVAIQGITLEHPLSHRDVVIEDFQIDSNDSYWLFDGTLPDILPSLPDEGIILPKSFREAGVMIGDRGTLAYHTPTASSVQEQQLPVYVAGFYDPGILPLGGKVVLANKETVSLIRSSYPDDESPLSNGFNIRFSDLDRAETVKKELITAFQKEGIDQYWKVETYREFEFTRDILQQLRSEKNLFTILAAVIIIVACSNIISMLIILVNDKKTEIGILRSMGASSRSIAAIFGFCGMVMGVVGSFIGILAAIFTLHNLQALIDFISRIQGFDLFNPVFYGDTLPNELSFKTLTFVLIATGFVSLLAGIVPAVKACMMRPSEILRSE